MLKYGSVRSNLIPLAIRLRKLGFVVSIEHHVPHSGGFNSTKRKPKLLIARFRSIIYTADAKPSFHFFSLTIKSYHRSRPCDRHLSSTQPLTGEQPSGKLMDHQGHPETMLLYMD